MYNVDVRTPKAEGSSRPSQEPGIEIAVDKPMINCNLIAKEFYSTLAANSFARHTESVPANCVDRVQIFNP